MGCFLFYQNKSIFLTLAHIKNNNAIISRLKRSMLLIRHTTSGDIKDFFGGITTGAKTLLIILNSAHAS